MASRPLGAGLLTAFSALDLSSRRISAASPGGTPYMPAAPGNGMAHPTGAAPAPRTGTESTYRPTSGCGARPYGDYLQLVQSLRTKSGS